MKKVKGFIIAIAIALSALVCVPTVLVQDNIQVVEAAKVKLNKTNVTLNVGSTTKLKVSGTSKKVKWSSSDKNVATVSGSGQVTAKGMGQATISAKVGSKTYTCKVTVNEKNTFSDIGDTKTLKVYGTSKKVKWSSSDKDVATVSSSGKVTAKGMGQATIYAKVSGKTFSTCKVIVNDEKTITGIGETTKLKVEGTSKNVTWSSSDKDVATVSSTGKVTAKGVGKVTITAKVSGSTYAKCVVTVKETGSKLLSEVGKRTTLSVGKTPTKYMKWSTSDSDVAAVNDKGVVTAKGLGEAKVYAKKDGVTYGTFTIYVELRESHKFTKFDESFTVKAGKTADDLTWTTSDEDVATVSSSGKITAKGLGEATIYAKDGKDIYARYYITATNSDSKTLTKIGATTTFDAGKTEDDVDWSSSNKKVATVSKSGKVTATGIGTATIYAKVDGDTYGEYRVTVKASAAADLSLKGTKIFDVGTAQDTADWSSDNTNVATVSDSGKVTAVGVGSTKVYAKVNGVKYGTFTVTVKESGSLEFGKIGEDKQFNVGKTNGSLNWTSSNTDVATVSNKGVVTAKGIGTATIYAKIGNVKYGTCNVTVKVKDTEKMAFTELGDSATFNVGKTSGDVTWVTSNKDVATVSKGKVTAVGAGKATIEAKVDGKVFATCEVTVVMKGSLSFDKLDEKETINIGKTQEDLDWSSSDTSVVTVTDKGVVKAVGVGTATVRAYAGSSTYATYTVTVDIEKASSMNFTSLGETGKVEIGANSDVTWTTSNANVAAVSNGTVTAKGVGTATIQAKIGNVVYATCNVTVKIAEATSMNFTSLEATGKVEIGANSDVTWTTSNDKVATVSNGTVTAKGVGTATIQAKIGDTVYATCNVKVSLAGVQQSVLLTSIGQTKDVNVGVNKAVTWTTSNDKVVTVKDGKLTSAGIGLATVNAMIGDEVYATFSVQSSVYEYVFLTDLDEAYTINFGMMDGLTWESSVPTVAEYKDGKIEANGLGGATIKARYGVNHCATFIVNVKREISKQISLGYQEFFYVGDSVNILDFESSNKSIVTVGEDGTMTAVGVGTAKVEARVGSSVVGTCNVTVKTTGAETFTDFNQSKKFNVGASVESVDFRTLDETVAKVNENGLVTPTGLGSTEIVAEVDGVEYGRFYVMMYYPDREIELEGLGFEAYPILGATPAGKMEWKSANPNIASVSLDGSVILATGAGKTTIEGTIDGIPYATYTVSVELGVQDAVELDLVNNTSDFISAGSFNGSVTWESSDESVVEVSVYDASRMEVTAKGVGSATIYAKQDGVVYAEFPVTVAPATGSVADMAIGSTETLNVGAVANVEWSSSDDNVATVADGVVTAVGGGEATIYAKVNGVTYGTFTVSVVEPTPYEFLKAYLINSSLTSTSQWSVESFKEHSTLLKQFQVEGFDNEVPELNTTIKYNASSNTIVYTGVINMELQLAHYTGNADDERTATVISTITFSYDLTNEKYSDMTYSLVVMADGIEIGGMEITNVPVGVARETIDPETIVCLEMSEGKISSLSGFEFNMGTSNKEKLRQDIVNAVNTEMGIEITAEYFCEAAECQAAMVFYELDQLLDADKVGVTLKDLGFKNF